MRSHGRRGSDPAVLLARASEAALEELAQRLALTLATVTGILDPQLIVLTGEIPAAGGEALRARTERALHSYTLPRPPIRLSSIEGNPVLAGALLQALEQARLKIFSRTLPVPSQGEQQ
jgi:predicted NBD/HSP70 family sugar kinase